MRLSSSLIPIWSILSIRSLAATVPHIAAEPASLGKRDFNVSELLPVPSQDSFFQLPNNTDIPAPGNVMKTRASPYARNNIVIGNCLDTFQVMYSTTDYNNNPVWTVTTVFIPASHANCSAANPESCSHGLVTYELPYDSCDSDATPSYLLQFGEPYGDMYDLLTRGYFVSVPDYEGRTASYTSGVMSGKATLDAVRAVLKVAGDFGFQTSKARTALWGYSGGALATGFAAEFAGSYAPELKLSGVVHGGLVPNVIDSGAQISNLTGFAGLVIAGIMGITSQHPEARAYIDSRLKQSGPYNITGFHDTCKLSGSELVTNFLTTDISDYFQDGSADLSSPILLNMDTEDGLMGLHGVPRMPMFIYQAISDELTSIQHVDFLVDTFCLQGANILYHRNNVGGHNEEIFQGRPRVLEYLSVVLDGKTDAISHPAIGCRTEDVTRAVNVTLVPTTAVEGSQVVNYSAVTVTPINVTVLPNGTVIVDPPTDQPANEPMSFTDLVGKLKTSMDEFVAPIDPGKRLDVISSLLMSSGNLTN